MLKQGISIPGVTLLYLFNTLPPDTFFALFPEKDKHLYYLFRDNMVGGPSIIFHRYHEKDKKKIREVETEAAGRVLKPCRGVVGYDANALYLWSIMQEMPTGHYTRRRAETNFRKDAKQTSVEALEWMEWLNFSQGLQLQHEAHGGEKRVGRLGLPVDGYDRLRVVLGVSGRPRYTPHVKLPWVKYVKTPRVFRPISKKYWGKGSPSRP